MSTPHHPGPSGGAPSGNENDDGSVDVGKEVADVIQPLVPWAVSVLFHAGILMLAIFIVWTNAIEPPDREVISPNTNLSQKPAMPVRMKPRPTVNQAVRPPANGGGPVSEAQSNQPAGGPVRTVNFGVNGGDDVGGGGDGGERGNGKGPGKGPNIGFNGIEKLGSPFRDGASGGSKFKVKFMENDGGNAKRVVYLIDASGSLIDTLPFVLFELQRSIGALSNEHQFTVIFFQGSEPHELPIGGAGLKQASDKTKKLVNAWLDPEEGNIVPAGLSNPIKAMRLALGYKPDLIFLLSDNITGQGRYEVDQRQLLAAFIDANRSHTKISTIQYLRPDPLEAVGMTGTMSLIARQFGGKYKYMGPRELNIQ